MHLQGTTEPVQGELGDIFGLFDADCYVIKFQHKTPKDFRDNFILRKLVTKSFDLVDDGDHP